MEFKSSEVMAYVLYRARETGRPLNKVQVQKILYCCYGAVLALRNDRLTDEHPKAWPYGPVFPKTIDAINKKSLNVGMALSFSESCDPIILDLINKTIKTFSTYTADQLAKWSYQPGSPWAKADPLASLDDREISLYFRPLLPVIEERGGAD